jgi:hypothetical protein
MTVEAALRVLADRWSVAEAAERANFQPYLIELCHALRVEPPRPAGSGYEFEYNIAQTLPDGREAPGFIDCYKRGHFILAAKNEEEGRSREAMLRLAFGTAKARLANLRDPAPPYLLVMDVGTTLMVGVANPTRFSSRFSCPAPGAGVTTWPPIGPGRP